MPRLIERIAPGMLKIGKVYYSDLRMNGSRIRRALSTDKSIAQDKLGDLIKQRNARKHKHPVVEASWEDFKRRFLKDRAGKRRATYEGYTRAIRELEEYRHITHLGQITPYLLTELYNHWKQKPRGLYVRNRDIQSLKAMMRLAESWGFIAEQKWLSVKHDKEPKGRLLWYSVKDLKRILKVAKGVWKTIAMLGARAGLRRSEIHWLAWQDVDFERDRLHVAPKPEWTPKDHERRWIPMTTDLRDYLESLPRQGEWVLDHDGHRPTPGSMTVYFHRLVIKKARLKGSIHTLRHTYASHLASNGASPKQIKEVMGHSKLDMTDRYMHLSPDAQQAVAGFLPSLK